VGNISSPAPPSLAIMLTIWVLTIGVMLFLLVAIAVYLG
jgi:hypothetical protein